MIIYKVVKSSSWPFWYVLDELKWFLLTNILALKLIIRTQYLIKISIFVSWYEKDKESNIFVYRILYFIEYFGILQWTTNKDRKTYVHKKSNINLKVLIKNLSSTQCKLEENLKWRRVTLSGPYAAKSFGQDAIRVAILAALKKTTTGQEKIKTGKVKL